MPRPPRCRHIDKYPDYWSFSPDDSGQDDPGHTDCMILTLDEYETIRLLDLEGLTQEECAVKMGVSRTTITAIYESTRRKLAESLVGGKRLRISGGSYQIGPNAGDRVARKERRTMRVAAAYDNGSIFLHFGHTEQFKLYDVEDGKIISSQIVDTGGEGHGALAGFLKSADVDTLICGGIGMGAKTALSEAGIQLYAGVSGSADEAVEALVSGTLQYDPDAHCDHHGHHEHSCYTEQGHSCSHSCEE